MDVNYYYYTLMLIPMLAGRSMMTIFSSAAVATKGKYEYFDGIDMVEVLPLATLTNLPHWVTDPKFLIATFILAILEKRISQSPSFQDFWNMNEAKIKGILAGVIAFVMVNETTDQIIKSVIATSIEETNVIQQAVLTFENAWVGVIAFFTWLLAAIRSSVMLFLIEADHDDSIGFRKMIGRLESALGMFGPLIFIIMPLVALACAGFAVAIVAFIKYRVRKLERKHHQSCLSCGNENHMSAFHCGTCDSPLENVKDVGFIGLSKMDVPAGDKLVHKQKLLESNRCSYCAS
ncbi:hypothetical protein L0668_07425 [Paraglaciecola aquimarina]|uniref:DUF4126 domain-containing protein n=1 Tax=Paraglaciecola algarum TaxID=3050085 RepID=A0ABS9D4W6_9ALTE|nr:hypothetical protein [Paraglaciecola sp. G1-23]MCF2947931.1 hypothetical protein [Paraglaciecola sp. G1-23]